jgi:hypothetical protein
MATNALWVGDNIPEFSFRTCTNCWKLKTALHEVVGDKVLCGLMIRSAER